MSVVEGTRIKDDDDDNHECAPSYTSLFIEIDFLVSKKQMGEKKKRKRKTNFLSIKVHAFLFIPRRVKCGLAIGIGIATRKTAAPKFRGRKEKKRSENARAEFFFRS